MSEQLTEPLLKLLGEESFVRLAEAFGGRRLYVPNDIQTDHRLVAAIGFEMAQRMSRRYGPDWLRIPLGRVQRAQRYRAIDGLSNGDIATRLGIHETSVNKIFADLAKKNRLPAKGGGQLALDFHH